MTDHYNNVSIAYAVVNIAGAMTHGRSSLPGRLAVGILSRAPGDGAPAICSELSTALGMEVLDIRMPHIEYHTGAMSVGIGVPFEEAVATGKPVMVILDEAQSAEPGVLEAAMEIIAKRVEGQPCAILAITTVNGERGVAERLAKGLGWDMDRIAMHRTEEENARLAERVLAAAGV
jgi:hypothetical protein